MIQDQIPLNLPSHNSTFRRKLLLEMGLNPGHSVLGKADKNPERDQRLLVAVLRPGCHTYYVRRRGAVGHGEPLRRLVGVLHILGTLGLNRRR